MGHLPLGPTINFDLFSPFYFTLVLHISIHSNNWATIFTLLIHIMLAHLWIHKNIIIYWNRVRCTFQWKPKKKNDIWNEPLCCSLPHRFPANWQIIIRIKVNSTFGWLHSSTCLFFGCIAIQFNSIQFSLFVCFTAFVNVLVFVFVVVVVVTATAILQLDIWFHWN